MIASAIIGWIVLSILAGVLWKNKNRSFAAGLFLSLFLSPIIGLIAGLVIKKGQPDKGNSQQNRN
ncbi:hypothetical protein ES705_18359 [subsurface metagenome]|jgi:ABC-type transport system involved in multi-copper enzyme maturation permease subunit